MIFFHHNFSVKGFNSGNYISRKNGVRENVCKDKVKFSKIECLLYKKLIFLVIFLVHFFFQMGLSLAFM